MYEKVYCARDQAKNQIKSWKTHLAADRTSRCRAAANQMRLFLHVGANWLMWGLRSLATPPLVLAHRPVRYMAPWPRRRHTPEVPFTPAAPSHPTLINPSKVISRPKTALGRPGQP